MINRLPKRFQYTIHNLIAHPIMEVLFQLGFYDLSSKIHDCTLPTEQENDQDDT